MGFELSAGLGESQTRAKDKMPRGIKTKRSLNICFLTKVTNKEIKL